MSTTTHFVPRASAIDPLLPDEIRMQAGRAGWMGTFALTASFLINDLLTDDEPVTATLVFDDDEVDTLRVVQGRITEWTADTIRFDDGLWLNQSEDLIAVTV